MVLVGPSSCSICRVIPDERNNLIDNPAYAEALAGLRGKVDALPPPRRKDADNRFIDPYRSMGGD